MKKIHHLSLVTTDIDLALNILNLNRSDIKETIFFDNMHLSNYGSDILANEIVSLIKMKENHLK